MGNFESKSTPYYSIIDEDVEEVAIQSSTEFGSNALNQHSMSNASLNSIQKVRINPNNLSLWTVKKANFDNLAHKNAILFEFNNPKTQPKNFNLALNQIKKLKTLRHPNIVKYLYSEESSHVSKCLLITESIRPLRVFLDVLSKEQIIRGIFGITNALVFLHEKAFISHNNLNESSIYLNGKQTWKLSDFELSLGFAELNRDNLKQIRDSKERNCVTPEEEKLEQLENDSLFTNYPHSIDAYCWAMLLVNILPKKAINKRARSVSRATSKKGFRNSSYEMDTSISKENENEQEEVEKEDEIDEDIYDSLDELEVYLHNEPSVRPKLSNALNIKLFNMYKNFSQSETSLNETSSLTFQSLALSANKGEEEQKSEFDPFKLNNFNDIESNWSQLVDYMKNITCQNMQKKSPLVNEKLIDFLLSPFMFFSPKMCKLLLPSVLMPKSSKTSKLSPNSTSLTDEESDSLVEQFEPFIELDKYKAFVIPRILNLFTMHSSQIRLVLLKYFPFYVHHINDMDTLKYEVLPELLLGLKDDNDQLVSLTFSCLAIMVNLLGSECVVGNKASKINKIFSENIPKVVVYKDESKSRSVERSLKLEEKSSNKSIKAATSSDSIGKKGLLNRAEEDENEPTNLAESKSYKTREKVFSDSMIGLHDQNESNAEEKENFEMNVEKSPTMSDEEPLDEWSNDFGWNPVEPNATNLNNQTNQYAIHAALNVDSSASIISLAGSDVTRFEQENSNRSPLMTPNNLTTSVPNKIKYYIKEIDEISSEFDIKSMSIKKRDKPKDDQENLIESFLNEMQPSIQKQETKQPSDSKLPLSQNNSNLLYQSSNLEATSNQMASNPSWDCEDIVDIDNV